MFLFVVIVAARRFCVLEAIAIGAAIWLVMPWRQEARACCPEVNAVVVSSAARSQKTPMPNLELPSIGDRRGDEGKGREGRRPAWSVGATGSRGGRSTVSARYRTVFVPAKGEPARERRLSTSRGSRERPALILAPVARASTEAVNRPLVLRDCENTGASASGNRPGAASFARASRRFVGSLPTASTARCAREQASPPARAERTARFFRSCRAAQRMVDGTLRGACKRDGDRVRAPQPPCFGERGRLVKLTGPSERFCRNRTHDTTFSGAPARPFPVPSPGRLFFLKEVTDAIR